MSNLTNDQLMDLVDETMRWGSEVSERWTGTLYEKQIDFQQANILKALERNNLDEVRKLVYDLAKYLDVAEEDSTKD
jgi:hypothetical protein